MFILVSVESRLSVRSTSSAVQLEAGCQGDQPHLQVEGFQRYQPHLQVQGLQGDQPHLQVEGFQGDQPHLQVERRLSERSTSSTVQLKVGFQGDQPHLQLGCIQGDKLYLKVVSIYENQSYLLGLPEKLTSPTGSVLDPHIGIEDGEPRGKQVEKMTCIQY